MGVNICMQTTDGSDHPDWDYCRYGGDKAFVRAFFDSGLGNKTWTPDGFPYTDDRCLYRPADITAFRAFGNAQESPERWAKAADIFEASPDYWFYFSW